MKVIIFGSTGRTGKYLIQSALEAGYEVLAFARIPDNIQIKHPRLSVFQGDVTQPQSIAEAMVGCNAVLSAVGTDLGHTDLREKAMTHIVAAMKTLGISRIIGIGGMGILQANESTKIFETEGFPGQYIPVSKDHLAAYRVLENSGLQYTFVCPPMIADAPETGVYQTDAEYPPKGNFQIAAGDLAAFMVSELEAKKFLGKRVGISS